MNKSTLKQLIRESVLDTLKQKDAKHKIEQAKELLKAVENIGSALKGLSVQAEKMYNKTEFPELKAEAKRLLDASKIKEDLYKRIEKKIESLEAELKDGKDKKVETPKKKLDEKTLSKSETKEKEKVVKGMKKNSSDFKTRYGKKDAKKVMYATATKIAKDKK